jgi:hypothetical protein
MAQVSHSEFGGSGQWMAGGAIMISDMFNHALKARVDAVCNECRRSCFRSNGGRLRMTRHARPQTAIYATSAR